MTRHFYVVDYAPEAARGEGTPDVRAFTTASARDGFVEDGNRRFSISHTAADRLCKKHYFNSVGEALAKGMI